MKGSVTRSAAGEEPVQSFIGCDAHRYSVFLSVDENALFIWLREGGTCK